MGGGREHPWPVCNRPFRFGSRPGRWCIGRFGTAFVSGRAAATAPGSRCRNPLRSRAGLGGASGIQVLTDSLQKGELRFRALGALAGLGDARALPAIQALFNRLWLPPYERTQAAGALAKLGDREAAQYLLGRTEKRRAVDRAFAIELCGEVKAPTALERLKAILSNEADECRGAAARGLGRLGDQSALPALLSVMKDEAQSDDLRLDAAEGACRLGGPQARAHVESLLASLQAAEAREEARELLEEWT